MPLTPNAVRTEERQPISHPVVENTRPTPGPKSQKGIVLTQKQREAAWVQMFEDASRHLANMEASVAVDYMTQLGPTMLACYIIAEEQGRAREQVLQMFPKPGKVDRERYHPAPPRRRSQSKSAVVAAETSAETSE